LDIDDDGAGDDGTAGMSLHRVRVGVDTYACEM
jgi:hypothetical protein